MHYGPLCLWRAGEDEEESDNEEDEELDKKMGDLGEGKTDTLDERMWGDEDEDDDDDDLEGSDREEESGPGMDQVSNQLQSNPVVFGGFVFSQDC